MRKADLILWVLLFCLALALQTLSADAQVNGRSEDSDSRGKSREDGKMKRDKDKKDMVDDSKTRDLEKFTTDDGKSPEDGKGQDFLTTNQGVRINDDQNSLKAGDRGPTIMEDFHFREKITHFDHERIPERVVHARGSGAHGYFEPYESLAKYTRAKFLQDPGVKTPVFVRFSTVAGSRGSTDLARDVRGFAVKFYTQEGNFDLVGNNMPVFFIQDAIKFPDFVHAVKPEPHNEIPQAASAHNTFWDFISLTPESMHMVMWLMSDRAIPRSLRMMQGFGVHTFRLVDQNGKGHLVKFHWTPKLGLHSVVWDEAQKISGKDPDFHRRDLWEAIETGNFPEYELGIQIVEEKDELKFGFDLLDPTKILPEELVPIKPIGRMVLNRNPDNFFAETEQVAFHLGNVVPGIDFTNDPLLQGRLFSYLDTQLIRLGGPNFHEIPINRPVVPVINNQRDGYMRQIINRGKNSYSPNSIENNRPMQAKINEGGYATYAEKVEGTKIRKRSDSFFDHFSQAALFWNSQTDPEKNHIVDAFSFELGKVDIPQIRERMMVLLENVDKTLAERVAGQLGLSIPAKLDTPHLNMNIPANANPQEYQPKKTEQPLKKSPALSMTTRPGDSVKTRKVAILVAEGFDDAAVKAMKQELTKAGATGHLVGTRVGILAGTKSKENADFSFLTGSSVLFDAVYVPGGEKSVTALKADPDAIHFINEAYKHCKPIAASGDGTQLLEASFIGTLMKGGQKDLASEGVIISHDQNLGKLGKDFINAISQQRFWIRETKNKPPA